MTVFLAEHYRWLLAFHIISFIAWMAALLYLPRLYVYHCEAESKGEASAMLEIMERRLYRAIMTPAMVSTYLFGILMLITGGHLQTGDLWIHVKLTLVVFLTLFHFFCGAWRRAFLAGENRHSSRFFRIANEVPTLLMIAIVVLAVIQPF